MVDLLICKEASDLQKMMASRKGKARAWWVALPKAKGCCTLRA